MNTQQECTETNAPSQGNALDGSEGLLVSMFTVPAGSGTAHAAFCCQSGCDD